MEHVKYDLGQLVQGSTVVVTLDKQANVRLMTASNYRVYSAGRGGRFGSTGGLMKHSPTTLVVPSSDHWFLAIDLGGGTGSIRSSVSVNAPR